MLPLSRRSRIASAVYPKLAEDLVQCSPGAGGGFRMVAGVRESLNGTPTLADPDPPVAPAPRHARATASGEVQAATMVDPGLHGMDAAPNAAQPGAAAAAVSEARGEDRTEAVRHTTRSPFVAKR